ncbi:unnamed protein product [Symbiodinium natans]|uniref:RRM domain-containing protein n=1 Tax=Symbiodinium natans TaxID=878477 RepID=A0A812JE33_9DINO|nr:unnamed protein product [Symbiodinium natans]
MALVDPSNPGGGILVDASSIGRPIGDTSSSAVFVSDLPKNFQGGDEALHFALGQLFGQYGKIRKIELYMDKGILETENFKGEALVVYHTSKFTGTHDTGDPVYEACRDLDGRVRVLGHRNWRIRCEAAVWQKEGFNVKDRAKKFPCVEIGNLWEYTSSTPMSWFMDIQEVIRKHVSEHIKEPFVKVEPSEGQATIWCKGAQDAMKLASLMQKSYFMGRKVVASLCRKAKPVSELLPRVPQHLSFKAPSNAKALDEVALAPGKLAPEVAAAIRKQAEELAKVASPKEPKEESGETAETPVAVPSFLLREGCAVVLKDLVSKPENNGKRATIVRFLDDQQKYQVSLEGRFVKLKPENVEVVEDAVPKRLPKSLEEEEDEDVDDQEIEANAQAVANEMANVGVKPADADKQEDFTASAAGMFGRHGIMLRKKSWCGNVCQDRVCRSFLAAQKRAGGGRTREGAEQVTRAMASGEAGSHCSTGRSQQSGGQAMWMGCLWTPA